jgi:hypothetical protein
MICTLVITKIKVSGAFPLLYMYTATKIAASNLKPRNIAVVSIISFQELGHIHPLHIILIDSLDNIFFYQFA